MGNNLGEDLQVTFQIRKAAFLINSVGRIIMSYFQTDIGVKMNRLKGRDFPPAVQGSSDYY